MRVLPRSLFGRNLLLLFGLFVFGIGFGALALRERVQKPRINRLAEIVTRQVLWSQLALESMPADHRESMRPWLNARGGGALVLPQSAAMPPADEARMSAIDRQFLEQLAAHLPGGSRDIRWTSEQGGTVWVLISIAGEPYWFTESGVQLEGVFPGSASGLLLLVGVLSVLGAGLIQRRINRPLSQLVSAAEGLAFGRAIHPLKEEGPLEIATVSQAFNHMSRSLAQADADRSVVLAGISHDLRTPLTKLRLAIEMLSKETNDVLRVSMLRSVAEMAGIIDQFIDYARMDGGEEVREVNLAQLLCDCVDKHAAEGRAISADTRSAPAIQARPQSIRRAVENLIENAYRYGGSKVSIECAPLGAGARISVLDRGPGIADEERDAVTKPFARGRNSIDTPGAGLGLAIVARVAQVHRGSLELLPREGGGLEARLNLLLGAGGK